MSRTPMMVSGSGSSAPAGNGSATGDKGWSWRDANRGGWAGLLPHFRAAAEQGACFAAPGPAWTGSSSLRGLFPLPYPHSLPPYRCPVYADHPTEPGGADDEAVAAGSAQTTRPRSSSRLPGDSSGHRLVIRNDGQTSRDVPIQLGASDGESPQEPEVFQGDPRVAVVRDRPLITSRGRRFKSCPRYKEKPQVRAGFVGHHGPGSCVRCQQIVCGQCRGSVPSGASMRRTAKTGEALRKVEPGDLLAVDPEVMPVSENSARFRSQARVSPEQVHERTADPPNQ